MSKRLQDKWSSILISVILGLGIVAGSEVLLRIFNYGEEFDFIIQRSTLGKPDKASLNSQYIALHYFSHIPVKLQSLFRKDPWFADTEFSKVKDKDTYRIFLVGASTTRGFPFPGRTINYSVFLKSILADVLPRKKIEVINAGYDALSSYGVLDVFRQVIEQSPDLIIVYTGHNEFIGHFGANSQRGAFGNREMVNFILHLQHSKLYLLSERFQLYLRSYTQKDPGSGNGVNLFRAMLKKSDFIWSEKDHQNTNRHFAANLQEMAELGKSYGVPILFSSLVSNLKDFPPIDSVHAGNLTPQKMGELRRLNREEKEAELHHDTKQAFELLKASIAIAPDNAPAHYKMGKVMEEMNSFSQARTEYQLARDYDKVHLRACSTFNTIITDVARKTPFPAIDMEEAFTQSSKNGLIGDDLFLEHVHPNVNGHLIIANTIAHYLARHNIIAPASEWEWRRIHSALEYVRGSGYGQEQLTQSRATVGRLLIDFPFYKCDKGLDILKSVHHEDIEADNIRECYRIQNALSADTSA